MLPLLALLVLPALPIGEEVVEFWPDGVTVKARYSVDEAGNRVGSYLEFHENGKRKVKATYRKGQLSGSYLEYYENGKKALDCKYKDGVFHGKYAEFDESGDELWVGGYDDGEVHGKVQAFEEGRLLITQKWKQGELVELDGLEPFPRPLAELRATVLALTDMDTPLPGSPGEPEVWGTPDEVEAAEPGIRLARERALRTLVVYRYLCGVRHEGMSLDAKKNFFATMGAKLCDAIGRLDHTPANPGWPADEYRDGYEGTSSSNLASVPSLRRSVHMYMDDSDPSNIDEVGHRRHCLHRNLSSVGFGRHGRFSAMYVFGRDGKGGGPKEICYPPAGYMPTEYFGPRHAWSIALPGGALPSDLTELDVRVQPLDEWYVPQPSLLIDHLGSTRNTLVFRPTGVEVKHGQAYLLTIEGLGGSSYKKGLRYLVEFVDLKVEPAD